jgi:proteasome lid subunit RPN8/RPN11
MPFRLILPRQIHDEIISQAQAELPNECCGLLAGRIENQPAGGAAGRVLRSFPLINAAASPREFESDARGMFSAEKERRRCGLEFLAVYHSHPTTAPKPSKTDLERNYSPDVVNLIVSLATEVPEVRGWWLSSDGYQEAEIQIV